MVVDAVGEHVFSVKGECGAEHAQEEIRALDSGHLAGHSVQHCYQRSQIEFFAALVEQALLDFCSVPRILVALIEVPRILHQLLR